MVVFPSATTEARGATLPDMTKTAAVLAGALMMAGCSGSETDFPSVDGHWRIVNGDVVCDAPRQVVTDPADAGPFTRVSCYWYDVRYAGQDHCTVVVTYRRAATSDAWGDASVMASEQTCR